VSPFDYAKAAKTTPDCRALCSLSILSIRALLRRVNSSEVRCAALRLAQRRALDLNDTSADVDGGVVESRGSLLCGLAAGEQELPELGSVRPASMSSNLAPLDSADALHYTDYQYLAIEEEAVMVDTHVSIGRVKRDISEIVNRVAYGGERVVLTSRGKPKAAIVSMEDYARLEREGALATLAQWEAWAAESRQLAAQIMERRAGEPLDVNGVWQAVRSEQEDRDARTAGR